MRIGESFGTSLTGLSALLRHAIFIFTLMDPLGSSLGRRKIFEYVRDLHSGLSSAMAPHYLEMTGRPLHFRAPFSVRPHVISRHPFGCECATQPVNNCRGARVIGIRATCSGCNVASPTITMNLVGAMTMR